MKIEVNADLGSNWRWHLRARNGKLVCTSGESFASKGNAVRAAKTFLRNTFKALSGAKGLPVVVVE